MAAIKIQKWNLYVPCWTGSSSSYVLAYFSAPKDLQSLTCQKLNQSNKKKDFQWEMMSSCFLTNSVYLLPPTGHCNNIHCLAKAINQIAAALFTIHKGSIEDRLKEFLAVRRKRFQFFFDFVTEIWLDIFTSCSSRTSSVNMSHVSGLESRNTSF